MPIAAAPAAPIPVQFGVRRSLAFPDGERPAITGDARCRLTTLSEAGNTVLDGQVQPGNALRAELAGAMSAPLRTGAAHLQFRPVLAKIAGGKEQVPSLIRTRSVSAGRSAPPGQPTVAAPAGTPGCGTLCPGPLHPASALVMR